MNKAQLITGHGALFYAARDTYLYFLDNLISRDVTTLILTNYSTQMGVEYDEFVRIIQKDITENGDKYFS